MNNRPQNQKFDTTVTDDLRGNYQLDPKGKNMIRQRLDELSEYESQRDAEQLAKQEAKQKALDVVLTAEIKAQLEAIELEFAGRDEVVEEKILTLTTEIKELVVAHGSSVKGEFLHAVYSKGRTSWDNKALQGYAADKPELLQFKKTGKPSVGIRKV